MSLCVCNYPCVYISLSVPVFSVRLSSLFPQMLFCSSFSPVTFLDPLNPVVPCCATKLCSLFYLFSTIACSLSDILLDLGPAYPNPSTHTLISPSTLICLCKWDVSVTMHVHCPIPVCQERNIRVFESLWVSPSQNPLSWIPHRAPTTQSLHRLEMLQPAGDCTSPSGMYNIWGFSLWSSETLTQLIVSLWWWISASWQTQNTMQRRKSLTHSANVRLVQLKIAEDMFKQCYIQYAQCVLECVM